MLLQICAQSQVSKTSLISHLLVQDRIEEEQLDLPSNFPNVGAISVNSFAFQVLSAVNAFRCSLGLHSYNNEEQKLYNDLINRFLFISTVPHE